MLAVAYKSRIDILVPPGVRVEMDGFGVSKGWSAEEELETRLPHDAPTVHVRGIAYKGTIETSTQPAEHCTLVLTRAEPAAQAGAAVR